MKLKKLLVLGLALACIATISITATLAYFTDNASVTNTFTVGHVDITLDETPVDDDGKKTEGDCVIENTYKLYPGKAYDKDPHIHVAADSEDCWVYVKIENQIEKIEVSTIHEQMVANGWSFIDQDENIYAYKDVCTHGEEIPTFTTFEIDTAVTGAELADYEGKTIIVTAYAIQAEGFTGENGVVDAWNAVGGTDKFNTWKAPTTGTDEGSEG